MSLAPEPSPAVPLAARPGRPPDHAAEARALSALAAVLAAAPDALLAELAAAVLGLCRAESAGVSVLSADGSRFDWPAVAGAWAAFAGGGMAWDASPCGEVIRADRTLLFADPGRLFPDPNGTGGRVAELLLAPFRVGGRPIGTVWAVLHTAGRRFDAEDARLLESVARFAAAGYQVNAALAATAAERDRFFALAHELLAVAAAATGRWVRVNPAMTRVLGWSEAEFLAAPFPDLVHPDDRQRSAAATAGLARGEPLSGFAHRVRHKDGSYRWVEWETAAADGLLYWAGRDVTARRAAAARDAFRVRLADALRPLADPDAVLAAACRVLGEHLGADRAYVVEVDEAGGVAAVRREYLRGDSPSLVGSHRVADFGWVIPPMRRGRTLVIPDVAGSPLVPPADRPAMAAVRIAAHVNAPLVKGGVLVAAMCVTEPAPRAWAADEVGLVEEVAERAWAAVERARAEAAVWDREARFRGLAETVPGIVWSSTDAAVDYFNSRWFAYTG